jgi:hypothetical protein
MQIYFIMKNANQVVTRPYLLSWLIGLSLAWATTGSEAGWLKTYGTGQFEGSQATNEVWEPSLFKSSEKGYLLVGSDNHSDSGNLIAKLDGQGKIQWSKKIVLDVIIHAQRLAHSETFDFQVGSGMADAGNNIWGRGKINPETGEISTVFAKKFVADSGGYYVGFHKIQNVAEGSGNSVEDMIVGYLFTDPDNSDVFVAKLDEAGNIVWSHVYDFKPVDFSYPTVVKFGTGYLIAWPSRYQQLYGTIVAKLDADGNIVADSPRVLRDFVLSENKKPKRLADGGVLLIGAEGGTLLKLDGNLNYVWGKDFLAKAVPASSGTASYEHDAVEELSDGSLEVYGRRKVLMDVVSKSLPIISMADVKNHLVVMRLSKDGDLLSTKKIRVQTRDLLHIAREGSDALLASGASFKTPPPSSNGDGLFARFDGELQPLWVRSLAGAKNDSLTLQPDTGNMGYLLDGQTATWGAGDSDLIAGVLNEQGTITGCSAFRKRTAKVSSTAQIGVPSTPRALPITPVEITDKGALPPGTIQDIPYPLEAVDIDLTETTICDDGSGGAGADDIQIQTVLPNRYGSGERLTVKGQGFGARRGRVQIGTTSANVVSWSDKSIVLVAPAASAGDYRVHIVNRSGKRASGPIISLIR